MSRAPENIKEMYHDVAPALPRDFEKWALDLFQGDHHMYYHIDEESKEVEMYCSSCDQYGIDRLDTKKRPKAGEACICPACGAEGTYKALYRNKRPVRAWRDVWIGQRLGDNNYILRFFRPCLVSYNDRAEELYVLEKMRIYIIDKYCFTEYGHTGWEKFKGVWLEQETCYFSSQCSLGGYYGAAMPLPGDIYPGTLEAMEGTSAQYSCTRQFLTEYIPNYSNRYAYTIGDWLKLWGNDRWCEAMLKLGFTDIIAHKLARWGGAKFNGRAKTPYGYLRIRKDRMQILIEREGDIPLLKLLQAEYKSGKRWKDETLSTLYEAKVNLDNINIFLKYMSVEQMANRMEKYAKASKRHDKADILITYRDYLNMCEELGYEMDSIRIYPKDLRAAHQRMVEECHAREADRRKKEAEERYKAIRTRYKNADKVYHYEKQGLLVRPAKNASEIIEEGRVLHHCVGGEDYLNKHAKRQTIILFLRKRKAPDTQYITIEMNTKGEIIQWYGAYDKKPDEKKIEKWLVDYCRQLDFVELQKEARAYPRQPKKRKPAKAAV